MKRCCFAALVVLLATVSAFALDRFAQIAVDATVGGVALPSTLIDPSGAPQANQVTCRVRTAELSFTYDGTAPTTTVGQLLEPGDWFTMTGHDRLSKFRAIKTGATSSQLDCEAYP